MSVTRNSDSPPHSRILFVCTGNLARSPYAELTMRAALRARHIDGVSTASAGTHAYDGDDIAPRMSRLLARQGIEASGFHSRPLTEELVVSADLILTAATTHRSDVVRLVPRAMPRVFTLRQFVRLIPAAAAGQDNGPRGFAALVTACAAARGMAAPAAGARDDIDDPWHGSALRYRRVARQIHAAVDAVVDAIVRAEPSRDDRPATAR